MVKIASIYTDVELVKMDLTNLTNLERWMIMTLIRSGS